MSEYILTWSSGLGRVLSNDFMFDSNEKFETGFEYDALYYETPTGNAFKVINGSRIDLTPEEVQQCIDYCVNFNEEADYIIQAYDADTRISVGTMMKSEAINAGYGWLISERPNFPVSRLRDDNTWERIVCVIMEDGHYRIQPDGVCPMCHVFFNKEEWAAWPKPNKSSEIWDFVTESWKDTRTVDETKTRAEEWVRSQFAFDYTAILGPNPPIETTTWPIQLSEARAWEVDNSAATPFIDGVITSINGARTKEEFIADILWHYTHEKMTELGMVHGKMYNYIEQLRALTTLDSIDMLTTAIAIERKSDPLTITLDAEYWENLNNAIGY